jgi:hypothetical protein
VRSAAGTTTRISITKFAEWFMISARWEFVDEGKLLAMSWRKEANEDSG